LKFFEIGPRGPTHGTDIRGFFLLKVLVVGLVSNLVEPCMVICKAVRWYSLIEASLMCLSFSELIRI